MAFHSLEVARQALFVQQSALHTTSHNIANANTEGYTRQRVNFEQQTAYPFGSRNRPQIPGQIGTGVKAGSIDRIRVDYLDVQYRTENSQNGYWIEKSKALGRLEALMHEPSDSGLEATINAFWSSLQDLSVNPDNSGARSVVIQRGKALAETFNYLSDTITNFRNDVKQQVNHTVDKVNNILQQINDINQQVSRLEPHGYTTNDLYDKRDVLIDELSNILNIEVTYDKSSTSELTPASAQGVVTIELLNSDGTSPDIRLVDGENLNYEKFGVEFKQSHTNSVEKVTSFTVGDPLVSENQHGESIIKKLGNGSMKALFELYNDVFPDMLGKLDEMASKFADKFNSKLSSGREFFEDFSDIPGAASMIKVIDDLQPSEMIVGEEGKGAGDATIVNNLLNMFDEPLEVDGEGKVTLPPIIEYYQSIIGDLAVETQQANQMAESTGVLQAQVQQQRQSVSAVSLDEEMTNLIQFQHAYNAAARNITTIDEMLDRVINNMGLVGR